MGPPRTVVLALAMATALAADDGEGPTPLELADPGDRDRIAAALIALSDGRAGALETLPGRLLLDPPALRDADGEVARRWTAGLARTVVRAGETAEADLARRYRHLARTWREPPARDRLAADCLPAGPAVARLEDTADAAFDRGRFVDYLAIRHLLLRAGVEVTDRDPGRAARARFARAVVLGESRRCPRPQRFVPGADLPPAPAPGILVRFHRREALLLAVDPWGGVRWQLPLARRAQLWRGDGGALVRDGRGTRFYDEDGRAHRLQVPAGVAVLGVAGGSAWFADGRTAYRVRPGEEARRWRLPDPPLSAPWIAGDCLLWLTRREVLQSVDGAVVARFRHLLPAEVGWRWRTHRARPVLVGGGRFHHLAGPDPNPIADAHRRGDHAAALRRYARRRAPTAEDQAWGAQALIARGVPDLAAALAAIPAPRWRLRLVYHHLATAAEPQDFDVEAIARLVDEHGDCELAAGEDDDYLVPVAERTWDLRAAAWWAGRAPDPPPPEGLAAALEAGRLPIADAERPGEPPAPEGLRRVRDEELGDVLAAGPLRLRLRKRGELTVLGCYHRDREGASRLRWRRRWRTPTSLPGRSLGLDGGRVMVAEAQSRLHLFRAVDGARTARMLLGNGLAAPARLTVLADDHLCWLGPAGFDDHLVFLRPGERPRRVELDGPARWIRAVAGRALVAEGDDAVRVHPGGVRLEWPFPVAEAPRLDHRGVWFGERCRPWEIEE